MMERQPSRYQECSPLDRMELDRKVKPELDESQQLGMIAKEARVQRIKEVRKQEKELARKQNSQYKKGDRKVYKEEQNLDKFREYQEKIRMIEELKQRKERILKDHIEMQQRIKTEQELKQRGEIEHQQKVENNNRNALSRGKEAIKREKERIQALRQEQLRIQKFHNQINEEARQKATKLTEDLREKERNRKIQEENDQFDPVSGMLNNQMIQKRVGVFDINHFAHTKSHQVFVVKEDQENATNAHKEAEKILQQKKEKERKRSQDHAESRRKAKQRGRAAILKIQMINEENDLSQKAMLEKKSRGLSKLENDKKFNRKVTMGGNAGQSMKKSKQKKMEKDFDQIFFGRNVSENQDQLLPDKVSLQAYWKDPEQILYETKKTREWGPKNKLRLFKPTNTLPGITDIPQSLEIKIRIEHQKAEELARLEEERKQEEIQRQKEIEKQKQIELKEQKRRKLAEDEQDSFIYSEESEYRDSMPFRIEEDELQRDTLTRQRGQKPEDDFNEDKLSDQQTGYRNTANFGKKEQAVYDNQDNLEPESLEEYPEFDNPRLDKAIRDTENTEFPSSPNLDNFNVSEYLQEQKQFLAKLEKDRKQMKEKILRDEQEALKYDEDEESGTIDSENMNYHHDEYRNLEDIQEASENEEEQSREQFYTSKRQREPTMNLKPPSSPDKRDSSLSYQNDYIREYDQEEADEEEELERNLVNFKAPENWDSEDEEGTDNVNQESKMRLDKVQYLNQQFDQQSPQERNQYQKNKVQTSVDRKSPTYELTYSNSNSKEVFELTDNNSSVKQSQGFRFSSQKIEDNNKRHLVYQSDPNFDLNSRQNKDQGALIQITDTNPQKNDIPNSPYYDNQSSNLAQRFAKKRMVSESQTVGRNSDKGSNQNPSYNHSRNNAEKLALRKKMMSYNPRLNAEKDRKNRSRSKKSNNNKSSSVVDVEDKELLMGAQPQKRNIVEQQSLQPVPQKSKISKKEMRKRNQKNYENLPEVKKRKEKERKEMDRKLRQEKMKEFNKKVRNKVSAQFSYYKQLVGLIVIIKQGDIKRRVYFQSQKSREQTSARVSSEESHTPPRIRYKLPPLYKL